MRLLYRLAASLWHIVSSRPARYAYASLVAALILLFVALHLEAFLFARNVSKTLATLEGMRFGTERSQVLNTFPELSREDFAQPLCESRECYTFEKTNSRLSMWLLDLVNRSDHFRNVILPPLHYLGLRYNILSVYVAFKSGSLARVGYSLKVSNGETEYPGMVWISASSDSHFDERSPEQMDESPNYRVYHHFKAPRLNTFVTFTPEISTEHLHHVLEPKLDCVWSLRGCQLANEILPEAEQDRLRILNAANLRMHQPDQCPERILPRRVRDAENVLLVQITKVGPPAEECSGTYKHINLRLLRTLKGHFDDRLAKGIEASQEIDWAASKAHNYSYDLLQPGRKLLLFTGASLNIDELCEAVPATESAIKTVETQLAKTSSSQD